ncbi:ABC transporter ATP-binding protein [Oceanobacillus sp. CFH 90083]|uniref:ABC transporter ATP-binding protein n=1 Tax=Oceanobacillus sp. CFH 90083 TaxID=2592336 RepID=UPI00128D2904|nr:ABC transporter ATP-binding protein [Oceanobacillus sp. CFH 90083]
MLISIQQLTKVYQSHTAVKGVTFEVQKGSCTALLGPNGAGKTTILNMLAGLLEPSSGVIKFSEENGTNVTGSIGFLPQQPKLFDWMTAEEFLKMCGRLSGLPQKGLLQKIREVLGFVGLENVRKKRIAGFSGGMKQRLGLAQAILHEPALLILDEPVSALDPTGRREFLELIQQMTEKMTVIFSTHILHDAEQICDEVLILQAGELKWDGNLQQLKKSNDQQTIRVKTKEKLPAIFSESESFTVEYVNQQEVIIQSKQQINENDILQRFMEQGITVQYFNADPVTLEEAYLEVLAK